MYIYFINNGNFRLFSNRLAIGHDTFNCSGQRISAVLLQDIINDDQTKKQFTIYVTEITVYGYVFNTC
jgi:hypothetical protein